MKKIILAMLSVMMLVSGCSTGKGKIEYVSIDKAFEMMDDNDTFLLLTSRESCSHCEDMKEMLKEKLPSHELIVYNVVLDESSSEAYIKDQLLLETRLEKPSVTPHVYYIEKGEVKDELLGFSKESPDKFWDWVNTLGLIS